MTRSDVEWTPDGAPPCDCGACLICEVESLRKAPEPAPEVRGVRLRKTRAEVDLEDSSMTHPYARTERDLRWLAVNFSAGRIVKGLPERLECLAAWHRTVIEAEKAANGQPNDFLAAQAAYVAAEGRMRSAGVGPPTESGHALSPCLGPDE